MNDRKTMKVEPDSSGAGLDPFDFREQTASGAAVVQVLEHLPEIDVPSSFAARIAQLAVAQPPVTRPTWAGFGPRITIVCGVLLLIALFVSAAHATPSFLDLRFDMELLLLLELGAICLLVPHFGSRE